MATPDLFIVIGLAAFSIITSFLCGATLAMLYKSWADITGYARFLAVGRAIALLILDPAIWFIIPVLPYQLAEILFAIIPLFFGAMVEVRRSRKHL